MSYDLRVVCELRPDFAGLRKEFLALSGVVSIKEDSDDQLIVVLARRGESEPVFIIDGPIQVEADECDEDFLDYVKKPEWQIEISIAAYAVEAALPAARAAAIEIAKMSKGAVLDPQEGGVLWPKQKPSWPRLRKPKIRSVDIVSFTWISALPRDANVRRDVSNEICIRFLRGLRTWLPDALPVRCDGGGRGPEAFKTGWRQCAALEYGSMLQFTTTAPCLGGYVSFSYLRHSLESPKHALDCVKMSVEFDAAALQSGTAADDFALSFAKISGEVGAIYGAAHLERGYELHGRQLFAIPGSEQAPQLVGRGWIGIPPYPAWLIWLHEEYAKTLDRGTVRCSLNEAGNGAWLRLSEKPCPADVLQNSMPTFPSEFVFDAGEVTNTGHHTGARAAPSIPKYISFQFV